MTKEVEISRFTFFYDIHDKLKLNSSSNFANKIDDWNEINLANNSKDKELPFCSNFQDIWENTVFSPNEKLKPFSKKTTDGCEEIIIHPFTEFGNKVIIFETKITKPLDKFKDAIESVKKDREKIYVKLIKSLLPNWQGDYTVDGDYFYFINIPLVHQTED